MTDTIRTYIAYRYQNWHDYATYLARVHKFESYADDLLNDIIVDLLKKPEQKINRMLQLKTKKIVNNLPTTEVDKFVLKMLKLNATSPTAPFRKNTMGLKIVSYANNTTESCKLIPIDRHDDIDTEYDFDLDQKLTDMHIRNIHRLKQNKFSRRAINIYKTYFINNRAPTTEATQTAIAEIQNLLTTRKTIFDD
jgi:hypothetical protein